MDDKPTLDSRTVRKLCCLGSHLDRAPKEISVDVVDGDLEGPLREAEAVGGWRVHRDPRRRQTVVRHQLACQPGGILFDTHQTLHTLVPW